MCTVVRLNHLHHGFRSEVCRYSFVFPYEDDTNKTVPFLKIDWWRWVLRFDAHHGRLDFRRGTEIVLTDFHEMVDTCEELCVQRETTVEFVTGFGHEAHRKLSLEHEYSHPEE